MTPHDVLILGTSPVLLLEGLVRARAGQAVCFLDAGERPGGAWASTELHEIGDVEAACHLLENYSGVYDFLTGRIGLELDVSEPAPLAMYGGAPREYNSPLRHLGRLVRVLVRLPVVAAIRGLERASCGRLRVERVAGFRIREALQKIQILRRQEHRDPIRYFAGGSPGMLRHLLGELEARGARFTAAKVAAIDLRGTDVVVTTANGESMPASEVVVSESLSVSGLSTATGEAEFAETVTDFSHVVAEVRGLPERLCSYVHLHEDPTVARVSDVTAFCSDVPAGSRVVCLQLRDCGTGTDSARVEHAFSHLKSMGAIPAVLEVLRWRVTSMPIASCAPSAARVLDELRDPRVTVLPSRGDLALSIAHNQKRWLAWLDRGVDPAMAPGPLIALPVR